MTEDQWNDVIDVNLTGVFHTVKAAVPSMLRADNGGSIMFISSIAGMKGYRNLASYVSAKHGIVGLMRTLANELAPYGIRVNTVHPTNILPICCSTTKPLRTLRRTWSTPPRGRDRGLHEHQLDCRSVD